MNTGRINQMFEMRSKGATLQQIADKFGVSRQYIHSLIPKFNQQTRKPDYSSWLYPAISEYCKFNKLGMIEIENEFGITYQSFRDIMIGKYSPRKTTIDKILNATCMTYEEAFRTRPREEQK